MSKTARRAHRFMLRGGWAVLFAGLLAYVVNGGPESLGASPDVIAPIRATLLNIAALILPLDYLRRFLPADEKEPDEHK